jgi:hypothetical protein
MKLKFFLVFIIIINYINTINYLLYKISINNHDIKYR